MKIAEAVLNQALYLSIYYGARRLIGNDDGDGYEVFERPRHGRHIVLIYAGTDEDAAVAALLGDDEQD